MQLELTGKRFGRLTVLNKSSKRPSKYYIYWDCICDCGTVKSIRGSHLSMGLIKSCGCLNKDRWEREWKTHGLSGTHQHMIWSAMLERCSNPKQKGWKNYGGRGITVCPEWHNYETFYHDMPGYEEGKSIERIDVNKGYSKDNCVWIDRKLQNKNTTRSLKITFNGETKILSEWCEQLNLRYMVAYHRFKKGQPLEEVFGLQSKRRRTRTYKKPAWVGKEEAA